MCTGEALVSDHDPKSNDLRVLKATARKRPEIMFKRETEREWGGRQRGGEGEREGERERESRASAIPPPATHSWFLTGQTFASQT